MLLICFILHDQVIKHQNLFPVYSLSKVRRFKKQPKLLVIRRRKANKHFEKFAMKHDP